LTGSGDGEGVPPVSVRVQHDGPVTTVTIDRPEARNAVDRPSAEALVAAFRAFDADDEAAVAVLTGAGGTFCAGADLKAVGSARGNRVEAEGDGPMGPTRMRLSKPVIAAIEGHAVAGGLELALWADLRVAADDAVLGVFCRRWGVPLIDGGTVRLPRLIGQSRAMDLVLTGRPVPAEEAHAIGLVNRLCLPGSALESAVALAHELAALPQTCLRRDRMSLLAQWGLSEEDAMGVELVQGLVSLRSGALEGASRFAAGAGRHGVPGAGPDDGLDDAGEA
jgi:enoyl-CoA hydratase